MKLIPVAPEVTALNGVTHKVILDYTDVAALGASATGTIALLPTSGTVPAGTLVKCIALNLITAFDFSDAGITSLLGEVGDGGNTARLCAQTELAVDGTEVLFAAGTGIGYAFAVADTVDIKFTAANGGTPTLAECNAGKLEVYLSAYNLNDLELTQ
jgi:hypothetical protein